MDQRKHTFVRFAAPPWLLHYQLITWHVMVQLNHAGGKPTIFTSPTDDHWRLVRKAVAPAFNPKNIRQANIPWMIAPLPDYDTLSAPCTDLHARQEPCSWT